MEVNAPWASSLVAYGERLPSLVHMGVCPLSFRDGPSPTRREELADENRESRRMNWSWVILVILLIGVVAVALLEVPRFALNHNVARMPFHWLQTLQWRMLECQAAISESQRSMATFFR